MISLNKSNFFVDEAANSPILISFGITFMNLIPNNLGGLQEQIFSK